MLLLIIGTGLAAYSVGPIPLPWIANVGFLGLLLLVLNARGSVSVSPGTILLVQLILYGLVLTIGYSNQFADVMRGYLQLPYPAFVMLRFVNLAAFAAALTLADRLITREGYERVYRWIVVIGFSLALLALYMYVAHIVGLPEPPRTRPATSGAGPQPTLFSSEGNAGYHRALGTFREPSHLAEWLLLPFFASLGFRGRRCWLYRGVLGLALLLTLSLTGFAAAGLGFMTAVVLTNPLRRRNLIAIFMTLLFTSIGLLSLKAVASIMDTGVSPVSIITTRTDLLLKGGLAMSNRKEAVNFVLDTPPPLFGYGYGNANLLISESTNVEVIVSFLSVYLNTLYATGIVGMTILATFLVRPLLQRPAIVSRYVSEHIYIIAAYCGNLVSFAVQSEEMSISFAITMAMLWAGTRLAQSRIEAKPQAAAVFNP